jgi:CheY-like chemotaxis protein
MIREMSPKLPVVLMSAYATDDQITAYGAEMASSIEKGLQVGAYACLYKPFESDALIGHIEEISRRKKRGVLGEPF